MTHPDLCDKPLAAKGLTSYRYKGDYGWIMIGAKDHEDALREANRSVGSHHTCVLANLQVWSGTVYVPCDQNEDATILRLAVSNFRDLLQYGKSADASGIGPEASQRWAQRCEALLASSAIDGIAQAQSVDDLLNAALDEMSPPVTDGWRTPAMSAALKKALVNIVRDGLEKHILDRDDAIDSAVEDVLGRAREYGFSPSKDALRGSSDILSLDLNEAEISLAWAKVQEECEKQRESERE